MPFLRVQETHGFWGCSNQECHYKEFCRERKRLPQVALAISSPTTFEVRPPVTQVLIFGFPDAGFLLSVGFMPYDGVLVLGYQVPGPLVSVGFMPCDGRGGERRNRCAR